MTGLPRLIAVVPLNSPTLWAAWHEVAAHQRGDVSEAHLLDNIEGAVRVVPVWRAVDAGMVPSGSWSWLSGHSFVVVPVG